MGVLKIDRASPNWWDKFQQDLFLVALAKGMVITARHVLANLFNMKRLPTLEYPEQEKVMPPGYRGMHRLTTRDDGSVRCVACMMCATACPAKCIKITAGEHPDPKVEKYPVSFDIDLLECVFCGMCVEACPCDAIRMDSGIYTFAGRSREEFVVRKEQLMAVKPKGRQ